jgi:glycine betaine/proline transport system substrate-binding protein
LIKKIGRQWLILAVGAMTAAMLVVACGGDDTKATIKFADNQFMGSIHVMSGTAQFIAEHGFGHPTELIEMTTPVYTVTLASGEVHVMMEGWEQNLIEWYDKEIASGNILNYGENFEGGPQFWVIPQWVHEQHGINTVQDMADNWELFKDPEDGSKGAFYNCVIGWQCAEINNVKLQAYGLDEQYNIISPGSAGALKAVLAGGQVKNEPIFGYYWSPTDLMGLYDWYILEEPTYNDADWAIISAAANDSSLRPVEKGVAYETRPINKLVHKSLPEIAPDFAEVLKKMHGGLGPLQKTLGWLSSNEIEDHKGLGAVHFMRSNTELVKSWMDKDTWKDVEKALALEPATN